MSFRGLLAMRCDVYRLDQTASEGVPDYSWKVVQANLPCRIDLSFRRGAKDPAWTPEAGRPADRSGVLFLPPESVARPGDRVRMIRGGVTGTFEIDGAIDSVVNRFGRLHHFEVGATEVAQALGVQ